VEETKRQAMAGDIPAIALYLGQNYATTIRQTRFMLDWQVSKEGGEITAVWKRTDKDIFEKVARTKTSDHRRTEALKSTDDSALYTCLITRVWGSDIRYWTKTLKTAFNIKPRHYIENSLYDEVGDRQQCALLGELCERLVCCHYFLQRGRPDEVFERYCIPSSMRNIIHNEKANTLWAKVDQCERYPVEGDYDYSIFGEKSAHPSWQSL